jgi:hypothetical protein
MGAKEWHLSIFPNDCHIALLVLRCGSVETVLPFTLDHFNGTFAGEAPFFRLVPNVSYMLMRTIVVRFVYTGYMIFSHMFIFCYFLLMQGRRCAPTPVKLSALNNVN